jgi:hypothetical protein
MGMLFFQKVLIIIVFPRQKPALLPFTKAELQNDGILEVIFEEVLRNLQGLLSKEI